MSSQISDPCLALPAATAAPHLRPIVSPFRIRDERAADVSPREALLDRCFGPARFEKTCERLREGRRPPDGLAFVATVDGSVVGTLRLWNIKAGGRPALLLGPLAVDSEWRCAGMGGALIEHGLRRAGILGHEAVLLVGDAPYYRRFGFEQGPTARLVMPGPVEIERFEALELVPTALAGAAGMVVATGAEAAPSVGHRAA